MNGTPNNIQPTHWLQSVKETLLKFSMIQKGDAVLVGVSGGPDSMALMHTFRLLAGELPITLGVAHLNHCLRGIDSDKDEMFVRSACKTIHLPCYTAQKDILAYKEKHRLSLEHAARRVRYDFYFQIAHTKGFNKIALAHHKDDNAELILMHLFRGSGPLGISGIPPIRNLRDKDIQIIRPFIELSKSHITGFLKENNIEYVMDTSNQDPAHLRNNVRNNLLPLLKTTYNPNIVETLNRFASIIRSEENWIRDIIEPLFEQLATRSADNRIHLCISGFNQLPHAAQRRIIRRAIIEIKGNIQRLTLAHVDSMITLARKSSVHCSLDFPDQLRALKTKNDLVILQEKKPLRDTAPAHEVKGPYTYTIKDPLKESEASANPVDPKNVFHNKTPFSVFIKEINAHLAFTKVKTQDLQDLKQAEHLSAFLDYDKLSFPLILRNHLPGDRFTPLGMAGTQKLKKYFIDHKIPNTARADIPVLLSNGKIIWVVGHRVDDAFKVISTTRNVFKAELLLA